MKVKPGDIITIDGMECIVDENVVDAIKTWKELFEKSGENYDEKGVSIGFYTVNGEAKTFPPSKILEALEEADSEQAASWFVITKVSPR